VVGIDVGFMKGNTGVKKLVTGDLKTIMILTIIVIMSPKTGIDYLHVKRKEKKEPCYKMKGHIGES